MATQHLMISHTKTTSRCIKHQHKSIAAAQNHLLELEKRHLVEGDPKPGKLKIYRCQICSFLHVGHSFSTTSGNGARNSALGPIRRV